MGTGTVHPHQEVVDDEGKARQVGFSICEPNLASLRGRSGRITFLPAQCIRQAKTPHSASFHESLLPGKDGDLGPVFQVQLA